MRGHNVITHVPKSNNCIICLDCKPERERHYRNTDVEIQSVATIQPKDFGDMLTRDHNVLGKFESGARGEAYILHCLDIGTNYEMSYPDARKDSTAVKSALEQFVGDSKVRACH